MGVKFREVSFIRVGTVLSFLFFLSLIGSLSMKADELEGKFVAKLSGKEEVPPVETKAEGEASFRLSKASEEVIFSLTLKDIDNPTGAHIHLGKKGEIGPPVADLLIGPKRQERLNDLLAEGTIWAFQLMGPLKGKSLDSLISAIRNEEAYVNVHTEKHPSGEIRGQIMRGH
jgi:hypothetical protein